MAYDQNSDIVIRAKNFKDLPDVENYINTLRKKGVLEKLANEKKLAINEVKKFPVGRLCNIFEVGNLDLEIGDIIIFGLSGNCQFFTSTPYDSIKNKVKQSQMRQ